MTYTLITRNGKIMQFFLKAMALNYQTIYGGVITTSQVLETVDNYEQTIN